MLFSSDRLTLITPAICLVTVMVLRSAMQSVYGVGFSLAQSVSATLPTSGGKRIRTFMSHSLGGFHAGDVRFMFHARQFAHEGGRGQFQVSSYLARKGGYQNLTVMRGR